MPTKLQSVQKDEETKKKARGVIASLAALLGVGGKDAGAKYSKKTEVTKHTVTEEDDSDDSEAEDDDEEEEAEEDDSDADAEAEEDAEAEDSATDKPEEESEEGDEEEEAIASAHKDALAAADKTYHAYVAKHHPSLAASLALRSPRRVEREMKRATGAKSVDDAMTALSRSRAKEIKKIAALGAEVASMKRATREQEVSAIVVEAKAAGRASSKDLRAELRAYGMANGAKALKKLVATLPAVATKPRIPKEGARGMSAQDIDPKAIEAMTQGLSAKERAQFLDILKEQQASSAKHEGEQS